MEEHHHVGDLQILSRQSTRRGHGESHDSAVLGAGRGSLRHVTSFSGFKLNRSSRGDLAALEKAKDLRKRRSAEYATHG